MEPLTSVAIFEMIQKRNATIAKQDDQIGLLRAELERLMAVIGEEDFNLVEKLLAETE
jgi:hypothetical protein